MPEDFHPAISKLQEVDNGYILQNITGIRAHIVRRLDGKGYDIVKRMMCNFQDNFNTDELLTVGPYTVQRGQTVYINDTDLALYGLKGLATEQDWALQPRDIELRFFISFDLASSMSHALRSISSTEIVVTSYLALFGKDPTASNYTETEIHSFGHGIGTPVLRISTNSRGCYPYDASSIPEGSAIFVERGDCTFLEKLAHAAQAGAAGVIVAIDNDIPINPSADYLEVEALQGLVDDVVLVAVTKSSGDLLIDIMDAIEADVSGAELIVSLNSDSHHKNRILPKEQHSTEEKTVDAADGQKNVLYINGNPLQNTILLI